MLKKWFVNISRGQYLIKSPEKVITNFGTIWNLKMLVFF